MAMIENGNMKSRLVDGVVVMTLLPSKIGEFEAPGISHDVESLGKDHGWRMVMDLSRVALLGSRGIGMLLALMKAAAANKGKLALCGLSDDLHQTLRVSALTRLFTIKDDVEKAVAAVK